jgi:uncharacterized protein (UPF0332 family)
MTWDDLGKSCRRAAQEVKEQHPRSCVSRAYYAAFTVLNERLLPHEAPPHNYETHAHRRLPDLIEEYLFPTDQRRRRSLRMTVRRLYNARLDADYRLSRTVDQAIALGALRDAKAIFQTLGVDDA